MQLFKRKAIEKMEEARKEQADYEMSLGLLTSGAQDAAIDEQAVIDRQQAMIQLTQWQQNRSPAMQRLFLNLAGCKYDKKQKKLVGITWNKGLVSIFGAKKLTDFAEEHDHNVMLGNYSEPYILRSLRDGIAHPLRRYLFNNHRMLGLEMNNAEIVLWEVMYAIEPTYWRAYKDGERRKDREIIKVNEVRNPYYERKNKGVFGTQTS